MSTQGRTQLVFQQDGDLHTLQTLVTSIRPFGSLEEENKVLFKQATAEDYAVSTEKTIFHPQGGGQPSDVGEIKSASGVRFTVSSARMNAIRDGQVLHVGRFNPADSEVFKEGDTVEQAIDVEKRLLYSRYHTAGHVLGSAVRHLLENEIEGFDELKASHFPDSASCEFQGSIAGDKKASIQTKVDEFIAAKMPVEIDWWDEEDFKKNGLERLTPDRSLAPPGEKFRVVKIVGAEVYPCGGTHVATTDQCGKTTVKKISRSKGNSRVSYTV